ncbi:MAG TPA: hypothetical protein VGM88_28675 [Kofleriaceae bacterium]
MRAWAILALLSGCFSPQLHDGTPCGPEGECPSGYTCRTGACTSSPAPDAGPDEAAPPDAPIDVPPGTDLVPSNGIDPALLVGATAQLEGTGLAFDTDTGAILSGGSTVRPAGDGVIAGIGFTVVNGMGVFSSYGVTSATGDTWTASGANAFVLFASSEIQIGGTIDVGATTSAAGPGGVAAMDPCTGGDGAFATQDGGGGGGAAGGTAGAQGGNGNNSQGGSGGAVCGDSSTRPLVGANHGGVGASSTQHGGAGGLGGGAVALVAMQDIIVTGIIGAPGGAGASRTEGFGGGGGGAGGAVFLESLSVRVSGILTANGGAGGCPSVFIGSCTAERGHLADAIPATSDTEQGGAGGDGGAGSTAPTAGTTASILSMYAGGGGGGAVGTIEIRSINMPVDVTASPPALMTAAQLGRR